MPVKPKKSTKQAAPIDRQWFEAQMRRVGTSATKLSEEIIETGHPSLLGRSLRGERELQIGELVALAKALRVTVNDVVRRLGYPPPRTKCSVVGVLNSRGRIEPAETPRTTDMPLDVSGDMSALEVAEGYTPPGIHSGATLYYVPSDNVRPDAFFRLSVIKLQDQQHELVGVLQRGRLGAVRVLPLGSTNELIESSELVSAAPVLWMRFA